MPPKGCTVLRSYYCTTAAVCFTSGNIPQSAMSNLDGNYTIFGEVVDGFAVVDSIERVTTDSNDKPVNSVIVESIQILEN